MQPLKLYTPEVKRSNNREHWLAHVGNAMQVESFKISFSLLKKGGSRAVFEALGDPGLCWKVTATDLGPTRRSGHGIELELGKAVPGIFGARTREVGQAELQIGTWGSVPISILEMERLEAMHEQLSEHLILHMAMVMLSFSCSGFAIRDVNKHNWGIRKSSPSSCVEDLVLIDGAGFEAQQSPQPFPPRRKIESWWNWVTQSDPEAAGWLRQQIESHHYNHRQLGRILLSRLEDSDAGQWVVVSLFTQRVIAANPRGETCLLYLPTFRDEGGRTRDQGRLPRPHR